MLNSKPLQVAKRHPKVISKKVKEIWSLSMIMSAYQSFWYETLVATIFPTFYWY
jgi:hypothetical protein